MIWNLEKNKNQIAFIDEYNNYVSYNEILRIACELKNKVNKRCLIFLLCENSIGSVLGYVSFVYNGQAVAMLSSHIDESLLENLIVKYCPEFLWIPKKITSNKMLENFKQEISMYEYVLLKNKSEEKYSEINEELCLLLTTSGSTGSPKFVRQSYLNVLENMKSIAKYLQIDSNERPITSLPMNYTYGLSIINSHLYVGATILLTEKGIMQKEFWDFLKKQEATSFSGVPYTYEMLDKLRFYRMKLPSLRTITQAGGKLDNELQVKFAEYAQKSGVDFYVMYGQCEATARMSYLPPEKALLKIGSIGVPIPGGEFKLIDDAGNVICKPFIKGELVYYGKNVTMGYAEDRNDLIRGNQNNGILYTGDMAYYDEDYYYYIVGRKKRFLKIYGNRVNLDEIDQLIKNKFGNIQCASSGYDDNLYIFVADKSIDLDLIKNYICLKTKLNSAAFNVVYIKNIPQNEYGKIIYKELERFISVKNRG